MNIVQSTLDRLKNFLANDHGAIAVIFSLVAIPVIGLTGASLDYSRALNVQSQLQGALDAAVLSAAHQNEMTDEEVEAYMRSQIEAHLDGALALGSDNLILNIVRGGDDGLIVADATLDVDTTLLGIMGINEITVGVDSAVNAAYGLLEVALVLDTTGSMSRHMDGLRAASQDFVDIVMDGGRNDNTSVALVPYVASVNIGQSMDRYLDKEGESQHHAEMMESRWIGKYDHCSYPAGNTVNGEPHPSGRRSASNSSAPQTSPLDVPGFRLAAFDDVYGELIDEIFGIGTAVADTPYDYDVHDGCYLTNPDQISHWQLLEQVDVEWRGCVEARPEPHDVLDTLPTRSNPDSLWVPYFWSDNMDRFRSGLPWQILNTWIEDGPFLNDTDMSTSLAARTHSVLKYTTANAMHIDESPPFTAGPNMACGNPVLPLTNNYSTVSNAIDDLSHWEQGGTQTAPGIAWGWRVLSPAEPFTEGQPYGDATKVMVVMTDGENYVPLSLNESILSQYSAYGYLRWGRYPGETEIEARDYVNSRMLAACHNAKAAGVIVYAVTFNLHNQDARHLWDECASEESMSYHVQTASDLAGAFSEIAGTIGDLRLTR